MYLVLLAWFYVTALMAVAEATAANGTVLGALITFVFYGLLPMAILFYILGTPGRKRALRQRRLAEAASVLSSQPDAGSHAPGTAEDGGIAPMREKP